MDLKSLYLLLLMFILISALQSQIVIDSTDMPYPGNIVNISTGLNVDFINYKETGENYTWDFSALIPIYQSADTFVGPSQTPFTYQFFFAGRTNLAYRYMQDLPIPEFELTNVFYYYKNSHRSYSNVGYAASLNVLPLPFVLSTPDVLYKFPLVYGDQDSSVSGVIYNLPDLAYLIIDRKRINEVDGWGTLISPFGTFDVLRMTSEVTEYDSIYIDSLEMGIPVNRHYTEYKWLAKGQKVPVLKITSEAGGLIVTYADSIRTYESVDEEFINSASIKVYPNPATTDIFIEFKVENQGDVVMELLDLSGKSLLRRTEKAVKGWNKTKFSLVSGSVINGSCLVVIRNANQVLIRKIVIRN